MPSFKVVLVEPQIDGNVGAVARAMANFGFSRLCMVNPCELTDEAFRRAKHARHILEEAEIVDSFEAAIEDCFNVVGTSGIITPGEKHYIRIPLTPKEFAERAADSEESIALIFGREDMGLSQDQLAECDMLINIPSCDDYPILNLSHAVSVVLYEIFQKGNVVAAPRKANDMEKDRLCGFFDDLLDAIDYPEFRRERTSIMFRRIVGRAMPTKWEYHTLMGIFGDAAKRIKRGR